MNKNYTIEVKTAVIDVKEYVRECVDVEKFLAFCKECGNYGKKWSCAPFDFNPLDIWAKYDEFEVTAYILRPEKGMTMKEASEMLTFEKNRMQAQLQKTENENRYVLGAGSCTVCEKCARIEGKPCRFPEKMRYSIEALGGDVVKTAEKYLGMKILWSTDGSVPEYLMPVGGVLVKKG